MVKRSVYYETLQRSVTSCEQSVEEHSWS